MEKSLCKTSTIQISNIDLIFPIAKQNQKYSKKKVNATKIPIQMVPIWHLFCLPISNTPDYMFGKLFSVDGTAIRLVLLESRVEHQRFEQIIAMDLHHV